MRWGRRLGRKGLSGSPPPASSAPEDLGGPRPPHQLEAHHQVNAFLPANDRRALVPGTPPGSWQKGVHGRNPRLQVQSTTYGSCSPGQAS